MSRKEHCEGVTGAESSLLSRSDTAAATRFARCLGPPALIETVSVLE
jgi:hypothetical protein